MTSTATPVIDSYRLMAYSVSPLDSGPRFTGKEMDVGTGLVYFGARYYDPEVGRFTTVDPIGDGTNWYVYCYNNPLQYIDSTGLAALDPFASADAAATDFGNTYYDDTQRNEIEYGSIIYIVDVEKEYGNIEGIVYIKWYIWN